MQLAYEDDNPDQVSNIRIFFQQIRKFNNFMEYAFSLPMNLLQNGVNIAMKIAALSPNICAACMCLTITTTLSATSVAVGVGVGVGVACTDQPLVELVLLVTFVLLMKLVVCATPSKYFGQVNPTPSPTPRPTPVEHAILINAPHIQREKNAGCIEKKF
ncbi:unnamed protein product [Rotaria magnacalcarata]|uniref:Uncharacterized protein n=1 Tax=Rotaria magnacalcarata TaxID=392030 RepID=A0A819N7S5_9BILA|nr:unnamed protein product [Rotaria magnacalcarata]